MGDGDTIRHVIPQKGLVYTEQSSMLVLCKPKILPLKSVTLEKLEKMQAAAAKKAEAKAAAAARAEAKKASAMAAAEAAREANAAKIAAKEEARARQLANMGEAQRAKIEAYNAAKAEGKKGPGVMDNMKRMYGL